MEEQMVSVIIPFFSNKEWLKEALISVSFQTYKNIEILIINDGSSEHIDDLVSFSKHPIKIINKKNEGPASARNLGIKESIGVYIAFLDSDDIWLPEKLSTQINYMISKNYVWSQHSYTMFWEDSNKTKKIDTSIYSENVLSDCFISFRVQTSCFVILRKILIQNQIFFPHHIRYGEDIIFFSKIARLFPLGYIEGEYSKFRMRGSNAGFNASVQLNARSTIWNEIKSDNQLIKQLPSFIIFAYKLCEIFSKLTHYLKKTFFTNRICVELVSKLLYSFPYVIFQLFSKKTNNN